MGKGSANKENLFSRSLQHIEIKGKLNAFLYKERLNGDHIRQCKNTGICAEK